MLSPAGVRALLFFLLFRATRVRARAQPVAAGFLANMTSVIFNAGVTKAEDTHTLRYCLFNMAERRGDRS